MTKKHETKGKSRKPSSARAPAVPQTASASNTPLSIGKELLRSEKPEDQAPTLKASQRLTHLIEANADDLAREADKGDIAEARQIIQALVFFLGALAQDPDARTYMTRKREPGGIKLLISGQKTYRPIPMLSKGEMELLVKRFSDPTRAEKAATLLTPNSRHRDSRHERMKLADFAYQLVNGNPKMKPGEASDHVAKFVRALWTPSPTSLAQCSATHLATIYWRTRIDQVTKALVLRAFKEFTSELDQARGVSRSKK